MTLKKLIQTHTWPNISPVFLKTYPDATENIKGYKKVFEKLVMMPPEETDISIIISKEKDDEEEHTDVSGLHNNPKNEEERYSQGIEFTPWRNWLGMDISNESLQEFSAKEIIVHCLYEMTFAGFNEEDIQKKVREINKSAQDQGTRKEGKIYVSASSIDKLLNE